MRTYPIDYLISYTREHSPFYKKLYSKLGDNPALEQLPFVDQSEFWQAADRGEVTTGKHIDGQVFKSGGTTGKPKLALYTAEEWRTMIEAAAFYVPLSGIKPGDRVANLFYGGGLYASFLFCHGTFLHSPIDVVQFSLSGNVEISEMADTIEKMQINVIAGLPSMIMKILEHLAKNNAAKNCRVDAIYTAGETLYPDQKRKAQETLGDKLEFRLMSYASNDVGFMAYYRNGGGFNEFRSSDMFCLLEIVDPETGELIREPGQPGKIYVTSLCKLLMPIIRYPAGDMGEFVDPEGVADRKFKLLGRSEEESARVGYVTLYSEDISRILGNMGIKYDDFQLLITHENEHDKLTVRIAAADPEKNILEELYKERPLLKDTVDSGIIHKPDIVYCALGDLEYNQRTGKLKRLIDKRLQGN
jgi:phenylacetate-CoA ligase